MEVSIFEKKNDFVEFLAHAWKEPSVGSSPWMEEEVQCKRNTCHKQLWRNSYIFSARVTDLEEFYVEERGEEFYGEYTVA